jgi:tetratricopeptide (TPR) repeat protein
MNSTMRLQVLILFLMAILGFIAGCVSTQTALPKTPGSSLESIGRTEFQLAVQEYERGNYSQAILSLMNLIQRYPGAPILAEAQWMLAKSYEAQGDYVLALEEHQRFMKNYPDSDHVYEAKLRADVLRQIVKPPALPGSRGTTRAVQFASPAFVNQKTFESTIQMLSRNGINALIISVNQSADPLPGVFFKTDQAPVIQDLLGSSLALANSYKMRVFASMPLREMDWLKDARWMDFKYDPATRRFIISRRLNLWNPAVQEYLLALYLDLAAYPLDGLIIEEPVGYSETEGFNEIALKQFNKDFGLSLTSSELYGNGRLTSAFWRWTGWKNRQVMAMLGHLVHELHVRRPQLRIGLAMPKEAVELPKEALVKYGQDLLEANQAEFDFFVFSWPPKSFRSGDPAVILKRLKDFVPDREKIILRIEPANPDSLNSLPEITDLSLAFVNAGDTFEWVQGLPSALQPARPFP